MAIKQMPQGGPGSEQHLGVDVGAQAGTGRLWRGESEAAEESALSLGGVSSTLDAAAEGLKVVKPLPHGVMDYGMAATMLTAPWCFGFSRNRAATASAVGTGLAILGLSLLTRYPLGAVKKVSFKTHGVVETAAAITSIAAPWLLGFARNRNARLTHVMSGLGTLALVAVTDYEAADGGGA